MKRVVLAAAIVLALRGPAGAQETSTVAYKVKQNDSLALIAAEFYGDRTKALFIKVANKLDPPRKLRPGERLKIPVSRVLITSPGDSFASIAKALLGDPRRGELLAKLNSRDAGSSLASGTELTIPFTVTHTAAGTETLAGVATTYFGDAKYAALIRSYNFLDKDAIEKGEHLLVPVFNVRLQPSKLPALDADARERVDAQRRARELAAKALPAARQAWRDGDFAGVKAALVEVEANLDYLEAPQANDADVLLGATSVAFDDQALALAAFKRVLARSPGYRLSAYNFSPKVLAAWKAAGGAIDGGA